MQSVSSRIWTRVTMSISYDNNHYTTGTSEKLFMKRSWNVFKSVPLTFLFLFFFEKIFWFPQINCVAKTKATQQLKSVQVPPSLTHTHTHTHTHKYIDDILLEFHHHYHQGMSTAWTLLTLSLYLSPPISIRPYQTSHWSNPLDNTQSP